MTPQEKAKELVSKYKDIDIDYNDSIEGNCFMFMNNEDAKQCALIAVDEILDELLEIVTVTSSKYIIKHINYYQEVKHEIEKL